MAHEQRWSEELFEKLELTDLFEGSVNGDIQDLGQAAGTLTEQAAKDFGLTTDTVVAVGIIDAHAGSIRVIGGQPETTLAIIGGTSSCHMSVGKEPVFVEGVWGFYWDAMVPGLWLSEGGQ